MKDFDIININTLSEDVIGQTVAAMSPARRTRIDAHPAARRRESAAAEYLAGELIFRRTGRRDPVIVQDERGRPFFRGCSLFLSLSHSGDYAAAAVSDRPVGIDIERLRPVSPGILRLFATENEQALFGGTEENILRLWTLKEAYFKATGLPFAAWKKTDLSELWECTFRRENVVGTVIEK